VSDGVGSRTYVITTDEYEDAIRKLRYLRKKGCVLHSVVIVVSVDDHRKIKNAILRGQQALLILVK